MEGSRNVTEREPDTQTAAEQVAGRTQTAGAGAAGASAGAATSVDAYREAVREVPYFSGSIMLDEPVRVASGELLPSVTIAYDTWGTLNEACDNVILVEHALTGNSHAADAYRNGEFREGWWNRLVGPGLAIDTTRFFVICSNVLGGCSGTTGPGSINPETGERYGMSFPVVTVKDMVAVQKQMLDQMGIRKLRAVIGGSLGGMQALVWAKVHPDMVERCIAVATTWRTSAQSIAFNEVGRRAILNDPLFKDGLYDKANPPKNGLAIARMIGHITYLCEDSMNRKFGRDLVGERLDFTMGKEFQVESYLEHQGYKFTDRFDASSYLYVTRATDYFSLCHSTEAITRRFAGSPVKFMLLSFDSDWLFPTSQMRELLDALTAAGVDVTFAELSYPFGHDSFLLEGDIQSRYIRPFVENGATDAPDVENGPRGRHHKPIESRPDLMAITELVRDGSRVLDLGCGDGMLLDWLRANRGCSVYGVDFDENEMFATVSRSIPVLKHDLDQGLGMFGDDSFDVVVLSLALMQLKNPKRLFREMLRVGKKVIVTFPNFGYWRTRGYLLFKGRMPVGTSLPYTWYETPNIHHTTVRDFRDFVADNGGRIEHESYLHSTSSGLKRVSFAPNLRSDTVIVVASSVE